MRKTASARLRPSPVAERWGAPVWGRLRTPAEGARSADPSAPPCRSVTLQVSTRHSPALCPVEGRWGAEARCPLSCQHRGSFCEPRPWEARGRVPSRARLVGVWLFRAVGLRCGELSPHVWFLLSGGGRRVCAEPRWAKAVPFFSVTEAGYSCLGGEEWAPVLSLVSGKWLPRPRLAEEQRTRAGQPLEGGCPPGRGPATGVHKLRAWWWPRAGEDKAHEVARRLGDPHSACQPWVQSASSQDL